MRLFIRVLLTLICFPIAADSPYQLPRSSVVELTEQSTGRVYPLFIQLPAAYDRQTDQSFPVIYLTDAPYSFPLITGATRFPMNSGVMKPAIIVAVSYETGSAGSASRVRDYTPTTAKSWQQQTGKAAAHKAFLRDVVIPYIESKYRATSSDRTFVGHSLGGLFGAYLLFTEPTLFSNYILASPSVWFDQQAILALPAVKPDRKTKVYISVGEYETPDYGEKQHMVAGAVQLKEKISAASHHSPVELKFVVVAEANHATVFPTAAIQGLDWIHGVRQP